MIIKALFEGKYCRDWNVTTVNKEREGGDEASGSNGVVLGNY